MLNSYRSLSGVLLHEVGTRISQLHENYNCHGIAYKLHKVQFLNVSCLVPG